jgi:antirestriction protein ArdC
VPYRGANVWLLWLTAISNGYSSPYWGTYDHIAELGGQVRKGQKSTLVIFWRRIRVDDKDGRLDEHGRPVKVSIPLLRFFRVFNADQADGLPGRFYADKGDGTMPDVIASAEAAWKGYLDGGPQLSHDDPFRAYYTMADDTINLPPDDAFESAGALYSVRFHEAGHSTGHTDRLARPGVAEFDHFGSGKYAAEELVAEMTAAMLCAVTGVEGTFDNSAAYVASWLRKLQDDPKLIVSASAKAQKAADLIQGITYDNDTEE